MLDIEAAYRGSERLRKNNWPLAKQHTNSNSGGVPPPDTTLPQVGIPADNIVHRSYSVTFESIRQNLGSYNYDLTYDTPEHIVRTYQLGDGKSIVQDIDMRVQGTIVTKLSGDTGYSSTLVKRVTYTSDSNHTVVYSLES